ncbi:MAG TPA: MSMEG_0565 family glycosyltransferase [Candidatus Dormibacteraeota bacterium]|jgi:glycosyltransferase-like protein|nr:MSMEG_0565 family glycosyltransferase [Candidatus Dormibacteraeota bacterium]
MAPRPPRVALVTYSTKPRGGVVHTLHLAEALQALGQPVHVFALGDPGQGFYRSSGVPHTVVPAPPWAPTLEERVWRNVDALTEALEGAARDFDLLHVQDCIAARAAVRVRDAGLPVKVVRTVHHVDDFTTPALIECQRRSIVDPDRVLVVSDYWRRLLRREYGVEAEVVTNGVDARRFARADGRARARLRGRLGLGDGFLYLTVGGIEPRKNSLALIEALAMVRARLRPSPRLAVVGGHSFQDHAAYREMVLDRARELGLRVSGADGDVLLPGTVPDAQLPAWYHAADAFVFPSVREGWGLAVLEAMAAGLPVIASDIPVFREYLEPGRGVLLVPPEDRDALASTMARLATDPELRASLARQGPEVAAAYRWERCGRQHLALYRRLLEGVDGP